MYLKKFAQSEEGAITVDWVVLTAAIVGMAAVATVGIKGSSDSVGEGAGEYLSSVEVGPD